MSCQWIYECVDCRTSFETDRGNHASEVMAAILAARPALAEVVATLEKHGRLLDDVNVFLGGVEVGPLQRLAAWFAAHRAHVVRLVNEYGEAHGTCGARVPCAGCGHDHRCALPFGHQGDHEPTTGTR